MYHVAITVKGVLEIKVSRAVDLTFQDYLFIYFQGEEWTRAESNPWTSKGNSG